MYYRFQEFNEYFRDNIDPDKNNMGIHGPWALEVLKGYLQTLRNLSTQQ